VHTPSEHTVNGKHHDLELHIVNLPHGDFKPSGEDHAAAFGIFFSVDACKSLKGDEAKACEDKLAQTDEIFKSMEIETFDANFTPKVLKAKMS